MSRHIIKAASPEAAKIRPIDMFTFAAPLILKLEKNPADRILSGVFAVNPTHATEEFTPCAWFIARRR
ncbi:MAG TPA: hypothetical protein PKA31_00060 [Candidatus Moranbacteria bacterium]|nr:hypothetical protein [Candidatus Moranbacteria bacterium]